MRKSKRINKKSLRAKSDHSKNTYKIKSCFYIPVMKKWNLKLKTFTLSSPKVRYTRTDLTKCVQGLFEEIYKTLMKEIKELKTRKYIPCS
jgi:hypothetical protein